MFNLPTELISLIVSYLNDRDLSNFSLVSKCYTKFRIQISQKYNFNVFDFLNIQKLDYNALKHLRKFVDNEMERKYLLENRGKDYIFTEDDSFIHYTNDGLKSGYKFKLNNHDIFNLIGSAKFCRDRVDHYRGEEYASYTTELKVTFCSKISLAVGRITIADTGRSRLYSEFDHHIAHKHQYRGPLGHNSDVISMRIRGTIFFNRDVDPFIQIYCKNIKNLIHLLKLKENTKNIQDFKRLMKHMWTIFFLEINSHCIGKYVNKNGTLNSNTLEITFNKCLYN